MKIEYHKEYSHHLHRDMEFKVFGHAGKPCLAFPSQNDPFYFYEDKGIIASMQPFIDQGRIQVFCVSSVDSESWSAKDRNPYDRIRTQEAYYHYIIEELVPRIYEINTYGNGGGVASGIMTYGCSLGAYQAMNFFLRRPDTFDVVLALSGIYHIGYFYSNYSDEFTFLNSPIDSLSYMDYRHPYLDLYRNAKIAFCVGKGAWEQDCIQDTARLQREFERLGVPVWADYWGEDMMHDWPSWLKQTPYFLTYLLD